MGNICRSPTAEAVLRKRARDEGLELALHIESAGTHGYHIGNAPDSRAQAAGARRGYDLSRLRARKVDRCDFGRFDFILAMDERNLELLQAMRPAQYEGYLGLLLDFAALIGVREVPDPYYGGRDGFERVLDMVERAAEGLIAHLRQKL